MGVGDELCGRLRCVPRDLRVSIRGDGGFVMALIRVAGPPFLEIIGETLSFGASPLFFERLCGFKNHGVERLVRRRKI